MLHSHGQEAIVISLPRQLSNKSTVPNSGFAIGGVSYSADTFVVSSTIVLRINFCGKMPAHRKAAKRWLQV